MEREENAEVLGIFKTRSLGRTTVALFRSTVSSVIRYFSLSVADCSSIIFISHGKEREIVSFVCKNDSIFLYNFRIFRDNR